MTGLAFKMIGPLSAMVELRVSSSTTPSILARNCGTDWNRWGLDVRLYGNFDGDAYGPKAQRLIAVGRKRQ